MRFCLAVHLGPTYTEVYDEDRKGNIGTAHPLCTSISVSTVVAEYQWENINFFKNIWEICMSVVGYMLIALRC